jgi:hypothetical protein
MHRCEQSLGTYRVTLMVLHHKEPYHVQIGGHHDVRAMVNDKMVTMEEAPWVGNEKPFEGELCEHELQFLNGLPGRDYPANYEFTVTKL